MLRRLLTALAVLSAGALMAAAPVRAEDRTFRLAADAALVEGGALAYVLPRFSLKTGVRVDLVARDAPAAAILGVEPGEGGRPVFQRIADGVAISLAIAPGEKGALAQRFADWLESKVGQRTVARFDPGGGPVFEAIALDEAVAVAAAPTGDAALGEEISLRRCGRCHVINDKNRYGGIGSTPSFGALKTLPRWRERFEAFWTLNPHPSFTQIAGVTPPFDPARPPPIAPLDLTLDEVDAILAFVIGMKAKDLGGALVEQGMPGQ